MHPRQQMMAADERDEDPTRPAMRECQITSPPTCEGWFWRRSYGHGKKLAPPHHPPDAALDRAALALPKNARLPKKAGVCPKSGCHVLMCNGIVNLLPIDMINWQEGT
jgi:hypothetical protein